jgi:predicted RNase H-like HicB family nuclease
MCKSLCNIPLDKKRSSGIMREPEALKDSIANVVTGISLLTVFIIKDNGRYMAKCSELDLIAEMDSSEEALKAMVEMIEEYAEDYKAREDIYLRSPNRAHHKPYVDRIMACQDECEIMKFMVVRDSQGFVKAL